MPIITVWGNPQGRSASFTQAQKRGNATSSKLDDFLLTRVKDYSIATIDNETLEASKGDANAFMLAASTEIDGAINALTRSQAIALYRAGYGEIGQVSGAVAGTTLTLSNPDDVTNFEVGMELEVAATISGASKPLGSSGNGLIVTGVNRSTGVLTFGFNLNDAANGIPTIAANDFIFVKGDHASSSLVKLAGIGAWIPYVAPTAGDNFFGVDRSVDTRLHGQRLNGTALPIEEALIEGASIVGREGGKLTHYFMSYGKYSELEKSLGSKVQYVDLQLNAEIGFRGIKINGPRGSINVIADQNAPSNYVYGLNLPSWSLNTLGESVRVIDTDGNAMLRQASADGVECRYGYYGNVSCNAPGHNIVIAV